MRLALARNRPVLQLLLLPEGLQVLRAIHAKVQVLQYRPSCFKVPCGATRLHLSTLARILPLLFLQESGVAVDEQQVAQLITMLVLNYNGVKGGGGPGDDGELSSAITNSLFSSSGEAHVTADGGGGGGGGGHRQGLWNLEVARQVLAEDYGSRLDWVSVAKAFDHDRFIIPDQVQ